MCLVSVGALQERSAPKTGNAADFAFNIVFHLSPATIKTAPQEPRSRYITAAERYVNVAPTARTGSVSLTLVHC